jgi:hypothetical protein
MTPAESILFSPIRPQRRAPRIARDPEDGIMDLFAWLRRFAPAGTARQTRGRPRAPHFRPTLQCLEDRRLPSFAAPLTFALNAPPNGIAVGDFAHTGELDLVTCSDRGSIDVLLGNGNGTFRYPVNYFVDGAAYAVATGDFNHDGYCDVAVRTASTVEIFLGGPGGVLHPYGSYDVLLGTYDRLLVGDFTGDGKLDIAVGSDSDGVSVLPGNGNGTFRQALNSQFTFDCSNLAKGDFNHDGKLDLVSSGGYLLLGQGDGTFRAASSSPLFATGGQVVAGDFDHSGVADFAVLPRSPFSGQPLSVQVFLNNGNGTAFTEHTLSTGLTSHDNYQDYLAAADFNGDGSLDLAVTGVDAAGDNAVTLLANPGNGWSGPGPFTPSAPQATVAFADGVAVGDLNGDGVPDLVAANRGTLLATTFDADDVFGDLDLVQADPLRAPSVSVLMAHVHNQFQPPTSYAVGQAPSAVVVGDFNGDGKPDLAVANYLSDTVSILMNAGDGTFLPAVTHAVGHGPDALAVGDFNHDGHLDLAVALAGVPGDVQGPGDTVQILLGSGDGTFQAPVSYTVGNGPSSIAVADFTGDGKLDLVTTNSLDKTFSILVGNGNGTFQSARTYSAGAVPVQVVVGDFNHDGKADLAMTETADAAMTGASTLSIFLGKGDGTFASPIAYNLGNGVAHVAAGDFNRDGKLDLAVANAGTPNVPGTTVNILLGKGNGRFALSATRYKVGPRPWDVLVGDFTGDGKLDLVTADSGGSGVSLFQGRGNGTFQTVIPYAAVFDADALAAGDFNGDHRTDLAVDSGALSQVVVLANDPYGGQRLGFGAASYFVNENAGSITVTVVQTGSPFAPVTVNYATGDGTATAGADYTAVSGTLHFAAGQTRATFTIPILRDPRKDGDETVSLILSDPAGGAVLDTGLSQGILTIRDTV